MDLLRFSAMLSVRCVYSQYNLIMYALSVNTFTRARLPWLVLVAQHNLTGRPLTFQIARSVHGYFHSCMLPSSPDTLGGFPWIKARGILSRMGGFGRALRRKTGPVRNPACR